MIEFAEFPASRAAEWDEMLFTFRDFNFQQTLAFAELDGGPHGAVRRWVLSDGARALVMAQALVRTPGPGICIAVIRGGPVYQTSEGAAANAKHLRQFLTHLIGAFQPARFTYIGMTIAAERSIATEIALREAGLSKPLFERAPYLTYIVPIHSEPDQNMKAFDRKWRNQLRRAEGLEPKFRFGNDDAMVLSYVALHNAMCRVKQIESYSITEDRLRLMQRLLGARLQLVIGSHDGEDVCGCVVVVARHKAFYYYAAANERGREGYFSNAMVWNLIQQLLAQGVTEVDMSAVDPIRNWGGYNFKRGVGGRAAVYEGEWEYCRPGAMKLAMDLALWWRTSRLYR